MARPGDGRTWRRLLRDGLAAPERDRRRLVADTLLLHIHPVKVRARAIAFTRTFYLGGLAAACFVLLTVTGVLLMFDYRPAIPNAYRDVQDLRAVVAAGGFVRNLHRWSAHAMVALAFLHLAVTFFRGAYAPPRRFNWVLGVMLFVVTILLSYTGYLLPWDQLAYWAVTVGTNMALAVPVVGVQLRALVLGGNALDEHALVRFHVLHCAVLPIAMTIGIALHVWRIRKDGGIHCPAATEESMLTAFPHLVLREAIAFVALCNVLIAASLRFDAPLDAIADPARTPDPAKAPWYFLGLQELLHGYPPVVAAVVIPGLLLVALVAVPYFRINLVRPPLATERPARLFAWLWASTFVAVAVARPRPVAAPLVAVALAISAGVVLPPRFAVARWLRARSLPFWIFTGFLLVAATLTSVGCFFRGPGWRFTLPWRDGIYG